MKIRALGKRSVEVVRYVDGVGLLTTQGQGLGTIGVEVMRLSAVAADKLGRALIEAAAPSLPTPEATNGTTASPVENIATVTALSTPFPEVSNHALLRGLASVQAATERTPTVRRTHVPEGPTNA